MIVNLNGYLGVLPEDKFKLAVPRSWLPTYVDYETYDPVAKHVVPPKEIPFDWNHMPNWYIEDAVNFVAWFLFDDQFELITFELRYL